MVADDLEYLGPECVVVAGIAEEGFAGESDCGEFFHEPRTVPIGADQRGTFDRVECASEDAVGSVVNENAAGFLIRVRLEAHFAERGEEDLVDIPLTARAQRRQIAQESAIVAECECLPRELNGLLWRDESENPAGVRDVERTWHGRRF